MANQKWIRMAGAGEMRGEGRWVEVRGDAMEKDFAECKRSGFVPVAWSTDPARKKVVDVRNPTSTPNFVIENGTMVHQFHEIATSIPGVANSSAVQYAQRQLLNLIKTKLEIDGTTA